jgi:hypothetical protein
MIILLGVFDIITVFLSLSSIYMGLYSDFAVLLLFLLGLKGVWTLFVTHNLFDPLGLLDIITAVSAVAFINYGVFNNLAVVSLTLLGLKSLTSLVKF